MERIAYADPEMGGKELMTLVGHGKVWFECLIGARKLNRKKIFKLGQHVTHVISPSHHNIDKLCF